MAQPQRQVSNNRCSSWKSYDADFDRLDEIGEGIRDSADCCPGLAVQSPQSVMLKKCQQQDGQG
jgi:hypothetical protein